MTVSGPTGTGQPVLNPADTVQNARFEMLSQRIFKQEERSVHECAVGRGAEKPASLELVPKMMTHLSRIPRLIKRKEEREELQHRKNMAQANMSKYVCDGAFR